MVFNHFTDGSKKFHYVVLLPSQVEVLAISLLSFAVIKVPVLLFYGPGLCTPESVFDLIDLIDPVEQQPKETSYQSNEAWKYEGFYTVSRKWWFVISTTMGWGTESFLKI